MADKLIFPIGFDLESGLKTAESDLKRVARQLESAIKKQAIKVPVGLDEATAKKLREEAKDIDRVLANIKNNYGSGQLKGLSIGFINTQKEIDGIKRLETQLQTLKEQRTSLVNGGATVDELRRIDAAIRNTEIRLKMLYQAFNKDQSSNVAISQQIIRLKQLAEELAGIDRMYARMQASAAAANKPVNSYEVNEMLARRREIMEEITRVTKTATEAQKELFNIKGVGVGASQGIFGFGGEQGLSAITAQISRYEELQNKLREVEGEYERLKAMQAQGMGDQSEKINQTLQRRIAIQKELGEITQTAAQAQKKLEKEAQATAAAFQRGRGAIENFNRVMKLPENRIMNIQQKINLLNQAIKRVGIGSAEFNKIAAELSRLGQKLDEAKAKQEALIGAQQKSGRAGSNAFREQTSYLNILIKRLAVYTSLDTVMGFLTKVREVTAQFELQRVSLGAIINDQERANMLFREIKQFALKSPIKILDLTKYTKQLAAFRFETDTLFDTTKRVADIAVGLSVPMDRLILALGHVKASTYLTGITLRQFSMAGIPMLELLAERYSKLEGQAVSTTDVLKRVHDKMVSFEDVNQIFIELTSSGGMFYNMQEKQGNTLYGMWAKLGDAASVMYDQIGNTEIVNLAMKGTIQLLTDLMKHWRFWSKLISGVGVAFLANMAIMKAHRAALTLHTAAGLRNAAAMKANVIATEQTVVATRTAGRWTQWSARLSLAHARAQYSAATATNVFSKALYSLKAAFLSNPLGMVILAVTTLIALFADADDSAKQFAQSLSEIEEKYTLKSLNDASNFKRLADAALKAAEGSKEQREKLEELDRTYGKIVGSENIRIDKLREMNREYGSLIDTIEEYNVKMKYSEREGAIKEFYGGKKKSAFGDFEEELSTIGFLDYEIGHEAGSAIAINVQNALLDELEKNGKATAENAEKILRRQIINTFKSRGFLEKAATSLAENRIRRLSSETEKFVSMLNAEKAALDANNESMENESGKLGELTKDIRKAKEELEKLPYTDISGKALDTNSFLYNQTVANETMKKAADIIRNSKEMKDALGDKAKELEPEWLHLVDIVSEDDLMNITTINFEAILKIIGDKYPDLKRRIEKVREEWGNIAPTDETSLQIRQRLADISLSFDPTLKKMKRFLWDGSGSVDDYLKKLKDQQEKLKESLKEKQTTLLKMSTFSKWWNKLNGKDIEAEVEQMKKEIEALDEFIPYVQEYTIPKEEQKKKPRTPSDDRLSKLNEIEQTLTKINQKYEELKKKEGDTKALEHIRKIYGDTLNYVNKLGKQFGLKFEMPTDLKTLQEYRKEILKVIETLKMKGYEKAALELQTKIDTGDVEQLQKQVEDKLKLLSDKISRTKTAKEFYDRILSSTGDIDLAASVSMSIYGDTGEGLQEVMVQQLQSLFAGYSLEVPIDIVGEYNKIDYRALEEYADSLEDKTSDLYKELKRIANEGQKDLSKVYEGYLKDLEKAKTYSDKRIELARTTAQKIAEIEASTLPQTEKKRLTTEYKEREGKEAAKLQYDAFKNSELYVQMFDDLDHASSKALRNMKDRLIALKSQWKNLDPTQLKELQSRLNDIDAQLTARNPFKSLVDAFKKYRELLDEGRTKKVDEQKAEDAEKERKEAEKTMLAYENVYQAAKNAAEQEERFAKAAREAAQAASEEERPVLEEKAQAAEESAESARKLAQDARKEADAKKEAYDATEKAADAAAENAKQWSNISKIIDNANQEIDKYQQAINNTLNDVRDLMQTFGASDEDLQYFDDITNGLNKIVDGGQDAATSVAAAMNGNYFTAVTKGISAVSKIATGVSDLFHAGKVKRANKEIKRQQELLEKLQYTYERLQVASDKLFGVDYISNYNQQMENLQAQATAYQKQAEAERSKGKKKDEEKIKEYEKSYQETMDKIKDMEDNLTSKFLGTDRSSAAREFAKAWLEAKASFASTTDAIKSKYKDLIQSMIIEGFAARVIDSILKDTWDNVNKFLEKGDTEKSAEYLAYSMDGALTKMDNAMNVLYETLKKKGIDVDETFGGGESNLSGIKREYATASEESINGLAQGVNTQNFYISQIHDNVAMIAQKMMEKENEISMTDLVTLQNRHLSQLPVIADNTAKTAERCERAAIACEDMAAKLGRVIKPRNVKSEFVINTQ